MIDRGDRVDFFFLLGENFYPSSNYSQVTKIKKSQSLIYCKLQCSEYVE